VDALVRKGLLDKVIDMEVLDFTIHDLYIEFAEAEAVAGPLQQRRFFIDKDKEQASTLPRELMKMPNLERLIIHRSGIQNLEGAKLHLCKNVEVLDLQYCNALKVVDVTNMENLRCLVVIKCDMLDNWKGVEKLNELAILYWVGKVYDRQSVSSEFAQNLSSLTALQVLKLENLLWSRIDSFPPNLSNCADLQELTISNYSFMGRSKYYLLVDFGAHLPTSVKKIDLSNCDVHMGRSPICSMSSLTNLQDLNLNTCIEIEDLTGLCELKSLERLIVVHTSICEIPGDMWKLKQLHFLDVSLCSKLKNLNGISQAPALQHLKASFCENLEELSPNDLIGFTQLQYLNVSRCRQLKSIVCIMHATALQQLDASECGSLRELPNDFSGLKNLKMLDLSWDESICKLPENYKSLAAHHEREGTLEGCWGLIVPLVEKLRGADMARVQCDDACHSECDSMEAWMEARKKFDSAAYHLLKQIIPPRDDEPGVEFLIDNWEYRLDASEVKDATIRALCEHDSRGGLVSNMLANVLEVLGYHTWWVVVATAPCTLAAVTKKAMLEPRRETLLHYTIEQIICTYQWTCWSRIIREDGTFDMRWDGESETYDALFFSSVKNGIMAVLQKCREKLEEAIVQGIDPVRSNEGKKVVDTLLREMEAATRQELAEDSILKQGIGDYKGMRYSDLFPNFPFEQILGSEFVRPNFPFEQILGSEFVRLH
jgi:Leucine-rich repeat (LRR) protein